MITVGNILTWDNREPGETLDLIELSRLDASLVADYNNNSHSSGPIAQWHTSVVTAYRGDITPSNVYIIDSDGNPSAVWATLPWAVGWLLSTADSQTVLAVRTTGATSSSVAVNAMNVVSGAGWTLRTPDYTAALCFDISPTGRYLYGLSNVAAGGYIYRVYRFDLNNNAACDVLILEAQTSPDPTTVSNMAVNPVNGNIVIQRIMGRDQANPRLFAKTPQVPIYTRFHVDDPDNLTLLSKADSIVSEFTIIDQSFSDWLVFTSSGTFTMTAHLRVNGTLATMPTTLTIAIQDVTDYLVTLNTADLVIVISHDEAITNGSITTIDVTIGPFTLDPTRSYEIATWVSSEPIAWGWWHGPDFTSWDIVHTPNIEYHHWEGWVDEYSPQGTIVRRTQVFSGINEDYFSGGVFTPHGIIVDPNGHDVWLEVGRVSIGKTILHKITDGVLSIVTDDLWNSPPFPDTFAPLWIYRPWPVAIAVRLVQATLIGAN